MNNYNWNDPLVPGTVVCAKYNQFDGTRVEGIFCVLYDEQFDNNVATRKNILAIKLSSRMTLVSNYSVDIDMDKNKFFQANTIACCSKVHILHKEHQVYKVLGKLDTITYTKIFKLYARFISETERQALDRL